MTHFGRRPAKAVKHLSTAAAHAGPPARPGQAYRSGEGGACHAGSTGARCSTPRALVKEYGVKTQGVGAPMRSLSGGDVQRAVLARELSDDAELLLVSNPVFGLDFAAVSEIHGRLMAARNRGAAVLLVSEDLDELLELSDRVVVMSEGRIVFECAAKGADRRTLGAHMGGQGSGPAPQALAA
jgi:general nucleoside transport system ATP-binding protein